MLHSVTRSPILEWLSRSCIGLQNFQYSVFLLPTQQAEPVDRRIDWFLYRDLGKTL
ncbi:hypothetical protein H6F89_21980 [Cyanobacteria bacterium FACHB-63]|nr:hypothetical protein [Cyanobacteria bacterium FACHB-63]